MMPRPESAAGEETANPLERVVMVARGVDSETGKLVDADGCSTNWTPVSVGPGDEIVFASAAAPHKLYFYRPREDEELSASYCYDDESNWTDYAPALSQLDWSDTGFTARAEGFVRVTFQTGDYAGARLGEYASIARQAGERASVAPVFADEVDRVVRRVSELRGPHDAVFMLISDIHHSVGDYWADTAANLWLCAEQVRPDAVVQLGDVTDGLTPRDVTEQLVGEVVGPLRQLGAPLLGCIGNHDVNYFRGNAEVMDAGAAARMYLERGNPNFHHDIPHARLRLIFLDSFDPHREERYGYSSECIRWLRRELRQTPAGWHVLAFSHVPPDAEHHFWSDAIENGPRLIKVLERFNRRRGGAVLGFIHGHNHADQIYHAGGFPIVSVGCAKFEYFKEKKPEGSFTPDRVRGTASQELWDVVVAKPESGRLEFVRFGAGDDRSVGA